MCREVGLSLLGWLTPQAWKGSLPVSLAPAVTGCVIGQDTHHLRTSASVSEQSKMIGLCPGSSWHVASALSDIHKVQGTSLHLGRTGETRWQDWG